MIVKRGHSASTPGARLDLPTRSREHFTVLVPRVIPGTKEGTRTLQIRAFEFAGIRGCPRNCERRASGPIRPLGNWEGRTDRATTREPGDLPAQSPNRWTGCPYGAVFRSGDGNAGAKAVRATSPTTFRTGSPSIWRINVPFASGVVFTDAFAFVRTQTKERELWALLYAVRVPRWRSRLSLQAMQPRKTTRWSCRQSMCPGAELVPRAFSPHRQASSLRRTLNAHHHNPCRIFFLSRSVSKSCTSPAAPTATGIWSTCAASVHLRNQTCSFW